MTEENKRENIRLEMEEAENIFSEAELLFQNGFIKGAVSRLYYAVLHGIRSILLTKGLEAKSHEGALRLLGLHFIKEGLLDTQTSHTFSKMMKFREEADYNPAYLFAREDYLGLRQEVVTLFGVIKLFLKDRGYS